jgi:hypothetical protein
MDEHPNLFGELPDQLKLLEAPPQRRPLEPEDVRQMMLALIAQARAAEAMPFEPRELQRHVAMFPIMAQWLPPEEGEQLLLEFDTEMERLRNAA